MDKILGWVFKNYKRRLDDNLQQEIRLFKASVDIKDVVRERLKGVRPGHPDDNLWLQDKINAMDLPERLDFLSKANAVVENRTFKEVVTFLMTEAQRKATLLATDMDDVNFQRANINAFMLLEEQLNNLASQYFEAKKEQDLMTLEEKLEII